MDFITHSPSGAAYFDIVEFLTFFLLPLSNHLDEPPLMLRGLDGN